MKKKSGIKKKEEPNSSSVGVSKGDIAKGLQKRKKPGSLGGEYGNR